MRWSRTQATLVLLLTTALACGQVVQELGDGSGGSGSPDAPTSTSGSKSNATAGTTSVSDDIFSEPCLADGGRCPQGYGCLLPWEEDGRGPILPGVCAPGCSSTGLGQPCAPNAQGTLGICRPFTVNPDVAYGFESLCTQDCDPLTPTCTANHSCEATFAAAGSFVFSCLPVTKHEPLLEGESCDGQPMGQCGPGLTCVSRGSFAKCSKYCDLRNSEACPSPQICVTPRDFPDGTVGICGDPD